LAIKEIVRIIGRHF